MRLFNDLPATGIEGGFMVELGDFHAGETRRVLLEIDVPAIAELGLAQGLRPGAALGRHRVDEEPARDDPGLGQRRSRATRPRAEREDPEVTTELAFQRAQRTKREATDALRDGRLEQAKAQFREASATLQDAAAAAPADAAPELVEEADVLDDLADRADLDARVARKRARADYHMKSRKRGRRAALTEGAHTDAPILRLRLEPEPGRHAASLPDARPDVTACLAAGGSCSEASRTSSPAAGERSPARFGGWARTTSAALDDYEGAPSHYRQRIVEVETDAGPVEAMTYVMTHDTYVGLPSPWYLDRIAAGFRDWELPVETLGQALAEAKAELERLGVQHLHPDGRKRLRAILDEASA